jgi:regulator of protease activity HflC (stomatin/prohibitin superfamily)
MSAFLIACALILLAASWSPVSANHVSYVRAHLTQTRRKLAAGLNFVLWPFESLINVRLPRGKDVRSMTQFAVGAVYRFDPPSYTVQTLDQIEVEIDLFAEYQIVDAEQMVDYAAVHDYNQILTDQTREKCNELVSLLTSAQVNAAVLNEKLRQVDWPAQFGLKIKSAGIQVLRFDERMQELIRLKAIGATPTEVVECMGRKHFTDALALRSQAPGVPGAGMLPSVGLGMAMDAFTTHRRL